MDGRSRRVLILDCDADFLVSLQRALEGAGIDTKVTWDKREACQWVENESFDIVVIGDHPPELDSVAILDDLSFRGVCPPVLILRKIVHEKDIDYFVRRGAIGVVSKGDPLTVLDRVAKALDSMQFKAKSALVRPPVLGTQADSVLSRLGEYND
jgi:DNA-binding response OmpR family regulator